MYRTYTRQIEKKIKKKVNKGKAMFMDGKKVYFIFHTSPKLKVLTKFSNPLVYIIYSYRFLKYAIKVSLEE